ncbi:MAG: hypothetical protein GZ090_08315 [Oxalobacteraceae bacterium]|nr:hypothetical protein [Oxalobacteraceae bacterium]
MEVGSAVQYVDRRIFIHILKEDFMKPTKFVLAAALAAAFAAPAMAGEVTGVTASLIANGTVIGNAIGVSGRIGVGGDINVLSESGAVLDTEQFSTVTVTPATVTAPTGVGSTGGTTGVVADPNTATIDGTAGNNAQGNIAVNVAAGNGNGQSNSVALSAVDAQRVFASAQTFAEQRSNNTITVAPLQVNSAYLVDALSGAGGNISANVAGGDGNLQQNQLAASVNSNGTLAKATGSNLQDIRGTVILGAGGINTATLGGAALSGAQGNIGANIAAGISNVQRNSLSIAAASGL